MGITGTKQRVFYRSAAEFNALTPAYKIDGALYYIHDRGVLYQYKATLDMFINYAGSLDILTARPGSPVEGKLYVIGAAGNYKLEFYNSGAWETIGGVLVLGETSSTAYRGDRGKIAYDHSQATGNPHNTTFASITSKPTTLAGFGITDAANAIHYHTFASITSKPTTLAGYGITDAIPSNIVANRGVGLESELPATAIVGDIYVSTDTFKVFQALNATDWQTDLLTPGVLITDTKATLIIVYQFLNNNLHTISGPEVFTDATLEISKNEDVTAITTLRDVLKNTSNYFIQSGAVITDNGDNTISISEAQAWVKTDIADNSEFKAVKIAAKDLTIEADKNILLYINYNAGVATFEQTESTPGFFYSYYNKIPFATCVNIGDSIIVNNFAEVGRNSVYKNTLSQINYQAFRYIEGLGTVSNVSRNVLTSPGVVIFANEGMTIAGLNTSSGGSFTRLYYDDGIWERIAGQTVIDNANYNDVTTGLVAIPNNKYAKKYLYYVKSLIDYYIVLEGQMTFDDLATAKTANLPAVLPPEVSNYYAGALLVAVFIVKAGEDEIIEIQNPFKQPFSSHAASNHDNLSGLTNAASEGAVNGHLTNEQYSALQNQISEGSGGGSAYLLNVSSVPTYNPDGSLKIIKQAYVSDPTKYYEQRFEYTNGLASKIEIKDDTAGKWVRQTNIYDANGQLQVPTITDIIEWTII